MRLADDCSAIVRTRRPRAAARHARARTPRVICLAVTFGPAILDASDQEFQGFFAFRSLMTAPGTMSARGCDTER